MNLSKLKVAIAGATGFVGSEVAKRLGGDHHVIGLSRSPKSVRSGSGIAEWRSCDFYSLLDAERGLEGANIAFYLVHSMLPSARLTQARFEDLDLIAADNFARAAKLCGVHQIIYLGGLIPESDGPLSHHLESRLEVEKTLGAHGVPLTALRAGLILGGRGSSFQIVYRLVQRLPGMICPKWTDTPTQPIAIEDVIRLLGYCVDREATYHEDFDIAGPEVTTYRNVILETARVMGRHPLLLKFPLFTPQLSRLWVKLVTGAPGALVYPLVESLRFPMVARDRRLQLAAGIPGIPLRDALEKAVAEARDESRPREPVAFRRPSTERRESDVRSVQRLPLPVGKSARWAAKEYLHWLPGKFFPIRVHVNGLVCEFRLLGIRLLILEFSESRSTSDRALFYIRGGRLAKIQGRGRLEFRETVDGHSLLVAVHEFRPRLPWYLYSLTQAKVHQFVMWSFGRHLAHLNRLSV
jgi:uncharacterized protein YbjT (DUF2867 family)